jgi:hypothetical protein
MRLLCTLPLLAVFAGQAGAASRPIAAPRHFDVGEYRVDVALGAEWRSEINKQQGYILFTYSDAADPKDAFDFARIGVFRIIVPAVARGADKAEIGAAYAVQDVAGAQKALFKTITPLKALSHKPEKTNGGLLFSYCEPIDLLGGGRNGSTKFVRACVFFPANYSDDGGLYLLVGTERFAVLSPRPDALGKIEGFVAGLQVRE